MQIRGGVCYGSRFTSLAAGCSDSGDHPAVAFLSLNLRFEKRCASRKSDVRKMR